MMPRAVPRRATNQRLVTAKAGIMMSAIPVASSIPEAI